jgi:D-3-phosphoglycerate dehydrogenase
MGIVGLGAIGREVALRARAFGMPVLAWSRSLDEATARQLGVERAASPTEVAARSDVVSLHVALTPQTRELASDGFFAAMRQGAIFINCARAEVMNAAALARAIGEKNLRAGLDVHPGEPDVGTGEIVSDLLDLPGVWGTHHIGASTRQAENAIADEAVRIVQTFLTRGEVPNCVNLCRRSPARWQLVIRHHDRVGVLAHVLGALRRHQINVEEVDNQIFDGALAACCTIRVDAEPPGECLGEIRGDGQILHVALMPLPT